MLEFILNNHPAILFVVVLLFNLGSFVNRFRTRQTTDTDDFNLIRAYAYVSARKSGKKIPFSAYGEWSKYTIKD